MVRTRAHRKFDVGERVLCYDPDSSRSPTAHDAKIADVVQCGDSHNPDCVEYVVTFQDRGSRSRQCRVKERHVLPLDHHKGQAQSSQSAAETPPRPTQASHSSGRAQSSCTEVADASATKSSAAAARTCISSVLAADSAAGAVVQLFLPAELRYWLDVDHHYVNKLNRLCLLPAEICVVDILDAYVRHWCSTVLPSAAVSGGKQRTGAPSAALSSVCVCRRVAVGLRVLFDTTLPLRLLYRRERSQFERHTATVAQKTRYADASKGEVVGPQRRVARRSLRLSSASTAEPRDTPCLPTTSKSRHSETTSAFCGVSGDTDDGATTATAAESVTTRSAVDRLCSVESLADDHSDCTSSPAVADAAWTVLPPGDRLRQPVYPSLVYGGVHLLRLIVSVPQLLALGGVCERRAKIVLHHCHLLAEFVNTRRAQLLGRHFYA